MKKRNHIQIILFFFLMLTCNSALWYTARYAQASWANVPPVPSESGLSSFFLGDKQFAFRATAIMLQNLGDTGGRMTQLEKYDYNMLAQWFDLADKLDPHSEYLPNLAAFYFGATKDTKAVRKMIDFLIMRGRRPSKLGMEDWRWLAQAVFLTRFREGDMERAYQLAQEMAAQWRPGRPGWMKQMPAFVLLAEGDKKAAYQLMMTILKEDAEKMDPAEVNFMVSWICERIYDKQQAEADPLCKTYK